MPDAIVVGAGPAGSIAATVLARSGLDVLLVDRDSFPRDKVCGDVIAASCFHLMSELGIPENTHFGEYQPIDRFVIFGPKGTGAEIELAPHPGAGTRIVRRRHFDERLRLHAIHSGAAFRQMNVQGLSFEDGQVVGIEASAGRKKIKIRSSVVIAADGATSTVARSLKQPRRQDKDLAVGLRGYVQTVSDLEGAIELSFLEAFQPGYAWLLPVGRRTANVGIGMRVDHYKKSRTSLSNALSSFMRDPGIRVRVGPNKIDGLNSWQLPMFSRGQRRLFDGAILVGDAGGFINPLTGDGIYQAMLTARYAAEATIDAVRKGDFTTAGLSLYNRRLQGSLLGELSRASTVQRLLTRVPAGVDALLLTARLSPLLARRVIAEYGQVQAVRKRDRLISGSSAGDTTPQETPPAEITGI